MALSVPLWVRVTPRVRPRNRAFFFMFTSLSFDASPPRQNPAPASCPRRDAGNSASCPTPSQNPCQPSPPNATSAQLTVRQPVPCETPRSHGSSHARERNQWFRGGGTVSPPPHTHTTSGRIIGKHRTPPRRDRARGETGASEGVCAEVSARPGEPRPRASVPLKLSMHQVRQAWLRFSRGRGTRSVSGEGGSRRLASEPVCP